MLSYWLRHFLQANAFDFGPAGCRDCGCNRFGSASLQCSSSGQCTCQANATGLKCTQCTLGFYGLPVMQCRGKTRVKWFLILICNSVWLLLKEDTKHEFTRKRVVSFSTNYSIHILAVSRGGTKPPIFFRFTSSGPDQLPLGLRECSIQRGA